MQPSVSKEQLLAASHRIMQYMTQDHTGDWGMQIHNWDWVPGTGVISIAWFAERSGEDAWRNYVIEWAQDNWEKKDRPMVINALAPFAVFPPLYEWTHDSKYKHTALEIGKWLLEEAPRTREGAYEHTVTENSQFPEQIWADTVFMAVMFLARLARMTRSTDYAKEALHQLLLHLRYLQDDETGVLFHGWNCASGDHMSAARWTRANAWIVLAAPEIIAYTEGLANVPDEILIRYNLLVQAALRYQDTDGLWSTVMDQPNYYKEISGSAGIACGLAVAVRNRLLDDSYLDSVKLAVSGILNHIENHGEVTGVSGGTPVLESIEQYNRIRRRPTLYGQGLTLMLLAECLSFAD